LRLRPSSGGVLVWDGDGGSAWTSLATPPGSLTVYSLDMADFDRDGYLDLLATTKGNGLRVWRGNGGTTWTDTSAGLPATGTFYDADFGRVDGDAARDIVAAEVGSTGVRVWTAFEPPPGGWDNFQPVGWVTSQTISTTIEVADAGSGLDVSTAEYRFSRDGGATWVGGWMPAACSGTDGVTTTQVITAASVPFDRDSATQNAIQFRVSDLEGLTGTSALYNVTIDTTTPTNPTGLNSTSHTVGTWDNDPTILFTWTTTGTDNLSGVDGYSFDLTQNPTERPDEVLDRDAGPPSLLVSEHASADGDWYWHFMTRDNAHNWSAPAHLGPYRIDTGPPTVPTFVSSSHTIGAWSNDNTIWISWSASDGGGSGVAGYSYRWTRSAGSSAGTGIDITGNSMTSSPLNPDGRWYLHILAIDQAGSAGDTAHIGPFNLDTTPPTSSASSPASVSGLSFTVDWPGDDGDGSDSLRYDVQYRDGASGTWTDWRTNTASTSAVFAGQHGHIYDFRSRARDQVGNEEAWPSVPDTTTRVATLDFEGFGLEVNQAVQDLNNSVVLVSHKRTFVRFHVRSLAHGDQGPVSARLRGWRDGTGGTYLGAILPNNPGGTITVLTDPDRGQLDESFYFDRALLVAEGLSAPQRRGQPRRPFR